MTGPHVLSRQKNYKAAQAQWREAFDYQAQVSGKEVRTAIGCALAAVYKLPADQTRVFCEAVELINTASLIHDDVLDGDLVRRGLPSVWAKYGVEIALNSGMYGYIASLQRLAELSNVNILRACLTSLEYLHVGQHLDLKFSNGSILPTMAEYTLIAQANTSGFFVLLLEVCQCLSPVDDDSYLALKHLLLELGVYYRYVNDYCDVNHIPHFEKKGFAPDLEGGPKSILMILAGQPLVKGKKTDLQKQQMIKAYGRAGVFDAALALIVGTYATLDERLQAIRHNHPEHDIAALVEVLSELQFQPGPADNYYLQCLA
ncbi:hypothetical protein AO391_06530 [Pseudomonas marginalis ICMP 9505]|nr:hypothetical protein AO391_06530 [Pseudomonas marginalis ICMP 9505]